MDVDTRTTDHKAVDEWREAVSALQHVERGVSIAQERLRVAGNKLGKQLTPADAKPGERFSIWHDAELVEVEVPGADRIDYRVNVRPCRRAPEPRR